MKERSFNTVFLLDDHHGARARMRAIVLEELQSETLIESSTITDSRQKIADHQFDLAILDLSLPDGNGDDLIRPLLTVNPGCLVVISTVHDESHRLINALSLGAGGYLLKDQPKRVLCEAVRGLKQGIPALSASVAQRVLDHLQRSSPVSQGTLEPPEKANPTLLSESLTPREEEILVMLARGFNRPDIAGLLNISKHTVATHVSNLYNKLGVSSRSESAIAARDLGLI